MFSERLRALRTERELTLQQLADKFGMSHSTLSKYETGSRKPNMEMLKKLSDFFGVSVDYILGESPVRNNNETVIVHKRDKSDELDKFPPEAYKELDDFIQYLKNKYNSNNE